MKIIKSLKLKIMLHTTIDKATLLIGVLEIIKRQGNNDFSNKASLFLDNLFSYQIKGTIFIEIPEFYIKDLLKFFNDFTNIYSDYGCIGDGAIGDAMFNIFTDFDGNLIYHVDEN